MCKNMQLNSVGIKIKYMSKKLIVLSRVECSSAKIWQAIKPKTAKSIFYRSHTRTGSDTQNIKIKPPKFFI